MAWENFKVEEQRLQVVKAYINKESSMIDICRQYGIVSRQLRLHARDNYDCRSRLSTWKVALAFAQFLASCEILLFLMFGTEVMLIDRSKNPILPKMGRFLHNFSQTPEKKSNVASSTGAGEFLFSHPSYT